MTENELAKRAVACKGWRWLPGMAWSVPGEWSTGRDSPPAGALPDLTDLCTLGGLLALVTEAYGWEMLPYQDSKGDWGVRRAIPGYRPVILSRYRCKAAALVAALEAEPSKWYNCAHCDAGYPDQKCTCKESEE